METYGFDEFGVELPTDNIVEVNAKRTNNLNTTGLHNNKQQPFTFTGYQKDEAGGMYFAQARRYDAGAGRFVSEDRVKGNTINPITTNPYQYCRNHPFRFIDPSGNDCYVIYVKGSEDDAENEGKKLRKYYDIKKSDIHVLEVSNNLEFEDVWEIIKNDESVEAVSIFMHGNPEQLQYKRIMEEGDDAVTADFIEGLEEINPEVLMIYACNAGHLDYKETNPASFFSKKVGNAPVVASDGTVYIYDWRTLEDNDLRKSKDDASFLRWVKGTERGNAGWLVYQYNDGKVEIEMELGKVIENTEAIAEVDEKLGVHIVDILLLAANKIMSSCME